ncbi:MAG: hypothetical protein R2873_14105 [Caldilineaceae bacterium]
MPAIDTVYFIHHSHTDIGYTHDQPVVWDMPHCFYRRSAGPGRKVRQSRRRRRFPLDGGDDDALMRWLDQASDAEIERFVVAMEA